MNYKQLFCAFAMIVFVQPVFATNTINTGDIRHPSRMSEVLKVVGLGVECHLAFTESFGTSKEDYDLLLWLVKDGWEIENDIDCNIPVLFDALNQIRNIAINNGNRSAAVTIIFDYATLGLDGEVAESCFEDYWISVLLGYNKLKDLLSEDNNRGNFIVNEICDVYENPFMDIDLKKITNHFEEAGLSVLNNKIRTKCVTNSEGSM